jgi:CRISPR-associated protein Csx17
MTIALRGLQPQPLGSYLAALGVLRLVATQVRPHVRGWFDRTGFCLDGIGEDELVDFLCDRYQPSPILTPWNGASGFYASPSHRKAVDVLKVILETSEQRFERLRAAIRIANSRIEALALSDAPADEAKARFIAAMRAELADDALDWIDAAAVIDGDTSYMMPLLGTGGNEGRLDYSVLFMRAIANVLLGDRLRCRELLLSRLFATATRLLVKGPTGQFEPGAAGGFNTGIGFEQKKLPNNPWTTILLIEGTLIWASAIASRQGAILEGDRFAVSPFTVRHRAVGHGSTCRADEHVQQVRAEIWVPVWRRPAAYAELRRVIAEGRMDVRGRHGALTRASDSLGAIDAIASLGIDRGVDEFVRYTLIKRRGDAFLALPTGRVEVRYRREVDLLEQLDVELDRLDRFLARFPGKGPPALLEGKRRAIDEARFEVALRGGHDAMCALVRAIGALELVLSRRDPGKDPALGQPLGGLSPAWIAACGDSTEVRLAAAIASLSATGAVLPMRAYLSPLDPRNVLRYAPAARAIAYVGADVYDRLGSVLARRLLDARRTSGDVQANPTWGAVTAELDDVARLIAGEVDERALEELLFGFSWVRHAPSERDRRTGDAGAPPIPTDYALLRLLFLPARLETPDGRRVVVPDSSIVPLLRGGRVADALEVARRQLVSCGLRPRTVAPSGDGAPHGRRLAAALLVPVAATDALLSRALVPAATDLDPTYLTQGDQR